MKFSDIDFGALSQMMNSLSDTDKEQLNSMANDMMARMQPEPEEEDVDYTEGLKLTEDYQTLDGRTLDALEQAWDLENFYDGEEADYSGSVLFLQKALLNELRRHTDGADMMSLAQILALESWKDLQPELIQVQTALYRAEYDQISLQDLQAVKDLVLPLLLKVKEA